MSRHRMRTKRRRAQALAANVALREALAQWHTDVIEAWSDYCYALAGS